MSPRGLHLLDGAELARAQDLVLIEEEHRNPRRTQQFVQLRPTGAFTRARPAGGGRLTDAMGLVEDEAVEIVRLGGTEVVEVLEHRPDMRRAGARHLAQRLGEGARPRGVQDRTALAGQLAEQ